MKTTPIDNGFLQISQQDALELAGGKLPKHGMEKLVTYGGKHYWLARTPVGGRLVWSIRETSWTLDKGRAVLRGDNIPKFGEEKIMKFSKWVELRECDGRPTAPHGMKKCACDEKKSKGTRDLTKDLSADYKGHVAQNGTVEPFKVLGNKGKSVAPVGK